MSLAFAAPAHAAPPDAEVRSRTLYGQAETLANNGDWQSACPLFQAAHDLHPTNGTAIRGADCYEKVAKYDRALELYQFVVDHADGDRVPERVMIARNRVTALRKQLGLDHTAPNPPVNNPPVNNPPANPPVVTPPIGSHNGPPAPLPPLPPPPPNRVPGIVLISVGGAGLLIGAITGGLALIKASSVKNECGVNYGPCNVTSGPGDKSSAYTLATVSDIGFIGGGLIAATGVVLIAMGVPKASVTTSGVTPNGFALRF